MYKVLRKCFTDFSVCAWMSNNVLMDDIYLYHWIFELCTITLSVLKKLLSSIPDKNNLSGVVVKYKQ